MSSAWITSIENNSSHTVRFIQTDDHMHPVIETSSGVRIVEQGVANPRGVQVRKGQTIEVQPRGRLTANWFSIPWDGWGKLEIAIKHSLIYTIGPVDKKDYLIVSGQTDMNFPIGREGMWDNLELKVVIDDAKGIVFVPVGSVSYDALQYLLGGAGTALLYALLYAMSGKKE